MCLAIGYSRAGLAALSQADVLIVGAGPTGLVLALWLTRLGVPVRIVDKIAAPSTTSRALAVQARTLEFYRQLGRAGPLARVPPSAGGGTFLGGGAARRAGGAGSHGRGHQPVPVLLHLPAGRTRAAVDRSPERRRSLDRARHGARRLRGTRRAHPGAREARGWADRDVRCRLHRRLRRRPLARPRNALDRLRRRDVRTSL